MIEIRRLSKTFVEKNSKVEAVQDVSLHILPGQIYGIIGNSGAGKSTLVRCLNLLEIPDSGELRVENRELKMEGGKAWQNGKPMREKELGDLRRSIGMIFQHFNLLDRSTVYENIEYPLKYSGMKKAERESRVMELLDLVGLRDKRNAYPAQLSGGQKQRVAIARALANKPKILLSDEATSALDPDATESILKLLRSLNEQLGLTIVLITHEMAVIKAVAERVAVMENGRIVEEGEVYDIFASPKEEITRRLVAAPGEILVRMTFSRESVGNAAISRISQEFGISVNIVLASVEELHNEALGGMVAILSGDEKGVSQAVEWLNEKKVRVEVLRRG